MFKKVSFILGGCLLLFITAGAIWFFGFVNPRHYAADDFSNLEHASSAALLLIGSGKRGELAEEDWSPVFKAMGAKAVKVYPSGVVVKLHGIFVLESGLYFPSTVAEKKLAQRISKEGPDSIYRKVSPGVYSYKITE